MPGRKSMETFNAKLARLGSAFVAIATLANFSGAMPAKADANAPFCLQP
jgi:hypothetical protein